MILFTTLISAFFQWQTSVGSTVSVSVSTQTRNVGEPLQLTCLLNPSPDVHASACVWYLGSDSDGIQRSARSCNHSGSPESYNLTRYIFTCDNSSNTYNMTIKELQESDLDQCWSCSVAFTNSPETNKSLSVCIGLKDKPTVNPTDNNTDDKFNKNWLFLLLVPIAFIIGFVIYIYRKKGLKDNCKKISIINPTDNNTDDTFNKNWLFLLFLLLVSIAFIGYVIYHIIGYVICHIIGFVIYHKKGLKDNDVGGGKGEEAKWQEKEEAEKILV